MKIRIKTKECNLKVRLKTDFGDAFDTDKLDRFCRACGRGFLKPHLLKKNLLEYTGPIGISLYQRLMEPMCKRDFLSILEQIVVALERVEANHLDLNAVLLNLHYVFVNTTTREVWLLYVPTLKSSNQVDVREFIESVVYSLKPLEAKDREFFSQFMYFFRAQKQIELAKIECYIAKEDESIVRLIRKQAGGHSGFMTNKMQHYVEHYEKNGPDEDATGPMDLLDDEATGLLQEGDNWGDEEATGLLQEDANWGDEEATGLLQEAVDWQDKDVAGEAFQDDTVPLQTDYEDTAPLDSAASQEGFHTLYRVSNEERISVNKPVYRLGKEKSYVDYFISNNGAVSRSHADLVSRGDKCFVIDRNSKNHTYINNEMIPVNCEVEIHDGDQLRLGNEEFIFYK